MATMTAAAAPAAPSDDAGVPHRGLITVSIMLATIMQVLDTTIANVALPSMTGDLGASRDTITWVLTSYIVAAAIMTPVTGWMSDRFGRRRGVHHLGRRLRHRLDGLRPVVEPGLHGRVPHPAGAVRRRHRAAVADVPAGHQPARKARTGDGDVGCRDHGRPDHRPDAGRLADRELRLALGVLHQPAGRHPRAAGLPGVSAARRRRGCRRLRLLRLRACCRSASARCS